MIDITLKADNGYFNYRVGAIILYDNKLLMVKNENSPYYYSVGGRVQFGETSEIAILREVYEETQLNFKIDKLVFIHENFFIGGFQEYKPFQEIALFFLMKPHNDIKNIKSGSICADCGTEALYWLPVDKLSDYPVVPEFFKSELKHLKNEVRHFITKDKNTFLAK